LLSALNLSPPIATRPRTGGKLPSGLRVWRSYWVISPTGLDPTSVPSGARRALLRPGTAPRCRPVLASWTVIGHAPLWRLVATMREPSAVAATDPAPPAGRMIGPIWAPVVLSNVWMRPLVYRR